MKIITKIEMECPAEDLKARAENGSLRSGDIIPITLKDGRDLELEVGRDESGKAFFVFREILEFHRMNKDWTNAGGWEGCEMREYANKEIFDLLPDELQTIIQPTKVVQIWDGKRHETMDKLFCLSETQVFGKNGWDEGEQDPEDTQLDIFKDRRGRIKNYDGSAYSWWLRSADIAACFRCVLSNGGENNYSASNSYGLVLGFTI